MYILTSIHQDQWVFSGRRSPWPLISRIITTWAGKKKKSPSQQSPGDKVTCLVGCSPAATRGFRSQDVWQKNNPEAWAWTVWSVLSRSVRLSSADLWVFLTWCPRLYNTTSFGSCLTHPSGKSSQKTFGKGRQNFKGNQSDNFNQLKACYWCKGRH